MKSIIHGIVLVLITGCCRNGVGGVTVEQKCMNLNDGSSLTLRASDFDAATKWRIVASREKDEITVVVLQGYTPVYGILLSTNTSVVIEEGHSGINRKVLSKRILKDSSLEAGSILHPASKTESVGIIGASPLQ